MDQQPNTGANRFCGGCGKPLPPDVHFCPSCGTQVQAPPVPSAAPPPPPGMGQTGLLCPRCGSPRVQTAKRGWKWTTGMIGSDKMVNTCQQCGMKF